MVMKFKVGNDVGNSEQDIVIDNLLIQQPSVNAKISNIDKYEDQTVTQVMSDIMNKLLITVDSPSCKAGTYLVGKFALSTGRTVNNMQIGLQKKSNHQIPIVNTLGVLAAHAVKAYYEKNSALPEDETIKISVDMTTSLPIEEYNEDKQKNARLFENRFMSGKHFVSVHLGSSRARVEITFDYVRCYAEAMTAMLGVIKNEDGDVRKGDMFEEFMEVNNLSKVDGAYFKNTRNFNIDIGEGTTEIPILNGLSPDPSHSEGFHLGVGHAIDRGLAAYKKAIGLIEFERQEFEEIIKDKEHKKHNLAMSCIQEYLEEQAEKILRVVRSQLEAAKYEVDVMIVYGGGSILLRDELFPALKEICQKENIDIKLLYMPEKYAVKLNAIGLANFVQTPFFESLKKEYKENKKVNA